MEKKSKEKKEIKIKNISLKKISEKKKEKPAETEESEKSWEENKENEEGIEDIVERKDYPRIRRNTNASPSLEITDNPVINLDTDLQQAAPRNADTENAPQYSAASYETGKSYDEQIYPKQIQPSPITPFLPETFSSGFGFRQTNELASDNLSSTNRLASNEYPEVKEANYQSSMEQESKAKQSRRRF